MTLDCLTCGACCRSDSPTFVRLTGADWARIGPAAERLAHFIGNRAYMRMADGHCAALAVHIGPDGIAHHRCTIYAERPQVCRDLEPGSPQCEAERLRKPEIAIAGLPAAARIGDNQV